MFATTTKPKMRRRNFNLIEVALAMGVVGITFGTLMNVLPVAALTSQKTMAENSASIIGASLRSMLDHTYMQADDLEDFVSNNKLIYGHGIPFGSSSSSELLDSYPPPKLETGTFGNDLTNDFFGNPDEFNISQKSPGLLMVKLGPEDNPVFSAYIRIWASPITRQESLYTPVIYRAKETEDPEVTMKKNLFRNGIPEEDGGSGGSGYNKNDQIIQPDDMINITVEIIYPTEAIRNDAEKPEDANREISTSGIDGTDWALRYAQIKTFSLKYPRKVGKTSP